MKCIAIGDLHGKTCWQQIDPALYDKIIFIGDYVDATDKTGEEIITNLDHVISFRENNPGKVTLLLGNHDLQYLEFPEHHCSGFDSENQPHITKIFKEHREVFDIAWQQGRNLFTHAGISQSYFSWLHTQLSETPFLKNEEPLADQLKAIYNNEHRDLIYACGTRRGGFYPHGGPLWADASETRFDFLGGYHHVVGHTRHQQMDLFERPGSDGSIRYIDVLNSRIEFYEVELQVS